MSNQGLYILHEGISSTIFTSQVMEHALCMEKSGVKLDILTFETFGKARTASLKNLETARRDYKSINIELKFGANIYLPFSTVINALLLIHQLIKHKNKYEFIHARADYTSFLCLITRPIHRLPVIWDCRGDAVGELNDSLSRKSGFLRMTLGKVLLLRQRLMASINSMLADGAVFVSKELRGLHIKKLRTLRSIVVPCPVPEEKFFFDEKIRMEMRSLYKLRPSQRVFLYSGSMVAYQGISEQFKLYRDILKRSDNFILFATPDSALASEYFKDLPARQFKVISVSYAEMNGVYNLADFAFMLREPKILNWVASPTKFGEYCLTGLPVILNETVQQASENSEILGNKIAINSIDTVEIFSNDQRKLISVMSQGIYSRASTAQTYKSLYSSTGRSGSF